MYTPDHYKMTDSDEILDFIKKNSFAILVSQNEGKLIATHIPILIKEDEGEKGFLYGHVAKANRQLENPDKEVLAIFPGPHKYISSSWYESNQSVPTWNYLSVHVYGRLIVLPDVEDRINAVKSVVEYFEDEGSNYSVDDLKTNYFEAMLRGIVAFKIEITEIEGKKKISQNHPAERQQRVIDSLEKIGDEDSTAIVEKMKQNLKKND
ncbi:MAG: FMN-binding negative transcriptional regulator [Ignavibacteria bacterium]